MTGMNLSHVTTCANELAALGAFGPTQECGVSLAKHEGSTGQSDMPSSLTFQQQLHLVWSAQSGPVHRCSALVVRGSNICAVCDQAFHSKIDEGRTTPYGKVQRGEASKVRGPGIHISAMVKKLPQGVKAAVACCTMERGHTGSADSIDVCPSPDQGLGRIKPVPLCCQV